MAARGASVPFVPTNNALPAERANPDIVQQARASNQATARENHLWVIPADVPGTNRELLSYGSSAITGPKGRWSKKHTALPPTCS